MGFWSWLMGREPVVPAPKAPKINPVALRAEIEKTRAKLPPAPRKPAPRRVSGSEVRKANKPSTSSIRRRDDDSYTPPYSAPDYGSSSYSSFDFGSSSSYDSGSSSSSSSSDSFSSGGGDFGGGGSSGDW